MNILYTIESRNGKTLCTFVSDIVNHEIVFGYFIGKNNKHITIVNPNRIGEILNSAEGRGLTIRDYQF